MGVVFYCTALLLSQNGIGLSLHSSNGSGLSLDHSVYILSKKMEVDLVVFHWTALGAVKVVFY